MEKETTVRICSRHQDEYPTPLIWTFAFSGAEYWCPHCGATYGMLGAGTIVDNTDELQTRYDKFEMFSEDYLMAKSTQVCSSLEWEGKRIKPSELPQMEQERRMQVINDWKYEVKIEDIPEMEKQIIDDYVAIEEKYAAAGKRLDAHFRTKIKSRLDAARTIDDFHQVKLMLVNMPESVQKTLIFRSILILQELHTT